MTVKEYKLRGYPGSMRDEQGNPMPSRAERTRQRVKEWRDNNRCRYRAIQKAYRRSVRGKFLKQKQRAKARGIEWLLTFDEWWDIWQCKWELRGRAPDQLVMARIGDSGPYAVGNVKLITGRENSAEVTCNRRYCG